MNILYRTIPLVCLVFVGCSKDPTEQFKSFVSKATDKAKNENIVIDDVSFDVEKTDLTNTQLTAIIELRFKDKDKTKINGYESWTWIKMFYVYQDNTWILQRHITDNDRILFYSTTNPQDLTLYKCFTP